MAEYFATLPGIARDELSGGLEEPQEIWNINVGASAAIERGMLLAADSPTGEFKLVSDAADASKVLVVARDNFTADADGHTVTQAYAGGVFNAERIKLGGTSALTIEPFVDALRKSNIRIRHLQEPFGKVKY